MKRIFSLIVGIIILGNIGFSKEAHAEVQWNKIRHPFDRPNFAQHIERSQMQKIYQRLELSDSQKELLEKNRKERQQSLRKLKDQLKEMKNKLRFELDQPTLNEENIRDLQEKMNQLRSRLSDERLEGIMGMREILSPEQYKLFIEITQ